MSETLYIVMPAYNEESNIGQTVSDWYSVLERFGDASSRLVVMDDGSSDGTFAIMTECAKKYPKLIPLTHPNAGHGATLLELYEYALSAGADYVFQTDTDGQTIPDEFEGFWKERELYDAIIGWRKHREDGLSRVIVTKTLRVVVRRTFGVAVPDANTPFRLMSAGSLAENLRYIPSGFNLSNVVLSAIYAKRGQRVKYIEITFRPRQGGVNSIDIPRIAGIGTRALKDFRAINSEIDSAIDGDRG